MATLDHTQAPSVSPAPPAPQAKPRKRSPASPASEAPQAPKTALAIGLEIHKVFRNGESKWTSVVIDLLKLDANGVHLALVAAQDEIKAEAKAKAKAKADTDKADTDKADTGGDDFNRLMAGLRRPLKLAGFEWKTTKNFRSGNGVFVLRPYAEAEAERTKAKAEKAYREDDAKAKAQEEEAKQLASLTAVDLASAVAQQAESLGISLASIRDQLTKMIREAKGK